MIEAFFKERYPEGLANRINPDQFDSIVQVFDEAVAKYGDKRAFACLGHTITFDELSALVDQFTSYLQNHTALKPGDRISIQLPNVLQYPVVLFGAMKAGLVIVNTNPLYTPREMIHQFNDSGATALVILANMAHHCDEVIPQTGIKTVIVTELGDLLPRLKKHIVNKVVKYVKRLVPDYHIAHTTFSEVLAKGKQHAAQCYKAKNSDLAVLQYTGGTTGICKGAMLTHRNIIANMLQSMEFICKPLEKGSEIAIAPLPLYHIYAFTVNCLVIMSTGNLNVLIPNPRDIPAFIKELKRWKFTCFFGLNTLFAALCKNEEFKKMDFSKLKLTVSGGMALTHNVAELWGNTTHCIITEGYGLTECSPVVCVNPFGHEQLGTIGLPLPSTLVKVIDEEGHDLRINKEGELCVKGPQVMKGYWQRDAETDAIMTADGWLRTGDIAKIQEDGYVKIVDRKKDLIIVSGFNVYPNELEDIISSHPSVLESAAIGVPDDTCGETIKMYIVTSPGMSVTEEELISYAKKHLTAYKVPKNFEFRDDLPKTNVGKVLRRMLRDENIKK